MSLGGGRRRVKQLAVIGENVFDNDVLCHDVRIEAVVGVVDRIAAHDVGTEHERHILHVHAILAALLHHFLQVATQVPQRVPMRHRHALHQPGNALEPL